MKGLEVGSRMNRGLLMIVVNAGRQVEAGRQVSSVVDLKGCRRAKPARRYVRRPGESCGLGP